MVVITKREELAIASLKFDEGYRKNMYSCTKGATTIGYGCNLDAGLSKFAAEELLKAQVLEIIGQINYKFPDWTYWFKDVSQQSAFINMCYQMGVSGVAKFKKAITALMLDKRTLARKEFFDSNWFKIETPARATRTIDLLFPELKGEPF